MADMTEADLRMINADADEDAAKLPGRLMDGSRSSIGSRGR